MNIERYCLLFIRYSLLGIPYCVFPIGYSLLGIPYWVFPIGCKWLHADKYGCIRMLAGCMRSAAGKAKQTQKAQQPQRAQQASKQARRGEATPHKVGNME